MAIISTAPLGTAANPAPVVAPGSGGANPLPSSVGATGTIAPPAPPPVTGGGAAPTIPVAETAAGATPVTVPPPVTPPTIDQTIASLQGAPSTSVTTDQGNVKDSLSEIQDLLTEEGTKDSATSALEATPGGVNDLTGQLNDINGQIDTMNTAANTASLSASGRLAPQFAIDGEQAQIARQLSASTLGLTAAANEIKGNLTAAQTYVTSAIAAEFDPLTSEVTAAQDMLTANDDQLSADEKEQADEISNLLTQRSQDLTAAATAKADVYDVALQAAKNGAPASVIASINATADGTSAVAAAGNYMVTPKTPTAADATSAALASYTKAFTSGSTYTDPQTGNVEQTVDSNGYITPNAWRAAVADAPAQGLTAADLISEFGSMLYAPNGVPSPAYGLTGAQAKLITGITPTAS